MKTSYQHDGRRPARRLRLPHERDESPDSQSTGKRPRIDQAARDIANGQTDTDARASPGVECAAGDESASAARRARPHLRDADPGEHDPGADPDSKSGTNKTEERKNEVRK